MRHFPFLANQCVDLWVGDIGGVLPLCAVPEGLAVLEERVFRDGAHPFIVLEPAGLPWKMVAVKGAPVSKDAGSSSKPRVSDTREAFPGRFGN